MFVTQNHPSYLRHQRIHKCHIKWAFCVQSVGDKRKKWGYKWHQKFGSWSGEAGVEVRTEGDSQELVIKTLLGQTGLFIYYESIKRELERQTCCETIKLFLKLFIIKRERTGEKMIFFFFFFWAPQLGTKNKALIPTRLCSRFWRLRFLPHLWLKQQNRGKGRRATTKWSLAIICSFAKTLTGESSQTFIFLQFSGDDAVSCAQPYLLLLSFCLKARFHLHQGSGLSCTGWLLPGLLLQGEYLNQDLVLSVLWKAFFGEEVSIWRNVALSGRTTGPTPRIGKLKPLCCQREAQKP